MVFHISMIPIYTWNFILWAFSSWNNLSLSMLIVGGILVAVGVVAKLIVSGPVTKKMTPEQRALNDKLEMYVFIPGIVLLLVGILLFAIVGVVASVGGIAW